MKFNLAMQALTMVVHSKCVFGTLYTISAENARFLGEGDKSNFDNMATQDYPKTGMKDLTDPETGLFDWSSDLRLDGCEAVPYELFLYATSHISLFAFPVEESACPGIMFHEDSDRKAGKTAQMMPGNAHRYVSTADRYANAAMKLPTQQDLEIFVDAFDLVDIDTSIPYDVVTHNCADLPLSMGFNLGVHLNEQQYLDYVTLKLFTHHEVANMVKLSNNTAKELGQDVLNNEDYEILHKLVYHYANEFMSRL